MFNVSGLIIGIYKEESEKVGLKLNIQKTKIMASGPITLWEIDGADSPVPSLQGPCDRSLKSEVPCGSCLNWR